MSDESDFLLEFKERKTVHITIRPAGVAEQDSADLMRSKLSLLNEIERLRLENEALSKCCTQRGARMQIMHDWMTNPTDSGLSTEWEYFLDERPDAEAWFDADGVPVRSEGS
jgi:hypothetical protein